VVTLIGVKEEIDEIAATVLELLGEEAKKKNIAGVSRLAPLPPRLLELQKKVRGIEKEVDEIKGLLASFQAPALRMDGETRDPNRSDPKNRKKIKITLDWAKMGRFGPPEVICEYKSSETMVKWARRLFEVLGLKVLEKLATFRVRRGPLITQTPEIDYRNSSGDMPYQYSQIQDTGFYILTHSSTAEKIAIIRDACRFLGFPSDALLVEEVDKYDWGKVLELV